jgi:hypothetical protein
MYVLYYKDREGYSHAVHRNGHMLAYTTPSECANMVIALKKEIDEALNAKETLQIPMFFGMISKTVEVPSHLTVGKRYELEQMIKTLSWTSVNFSITSKVDLNVLKNGK